MHQFTYTSLSVTQTEKLWDPHFFTNSFSTSVTTSLTETRRAADRCETTVYQQINGLAEVQSSGKTQINRPIAANPEHRITFEVTRKAQKAMAMTFLGNQK